jgi:hypothetical protein
MSNVDGVVRAAFARLPNEASRREFMRLAGGVGAMAALAACGDGISVTGFEGTPATGGLTGATAETITLDFRQPGDVLRYAFALEALEADFYTRVVADAGFATAFGSAAERQLLTDVRDHEVAHREFLRAALAAAGVAVPTLTTRYPATLNFADRTAVLQTARTFEDLGVSAYNGAGRYLASRADLLTLAGKIVSVEARHAAAIRDLLAPNTDRFANVSDLGALGANDALGLDAKASPTAVLAAAQPFVAQTITATGVAA